MTAPHPHTGGVSAGRAAARLVDPQLIVEFSVGDDMPQRLNFEGLELLAGLYHEGRVRAGSATTQTTPVRHVPGPASWACQRSVSQRRPVSGPLRRA